MKTKLVALLLAILALCSCVKDEMLSSQEKLHKAARQTFSASVLYTTRVMYFCDLFQQYMDASDEEKKSKKFASIRQSVKMMTEGDVYWPSTYIVNTYDRFIDKKSGYDVLYDSEILFNDIVMESNDISFFVPGGSLTFYERPNLIHTSDINLTITCVEKGKWKVTVAKRHFSYEDYGTFEAVYQKNDSGEFIDCVGMFDSNSDNTQGYSARFQTLGNVKYNREQRLFSGSFLMTTFDEFGATLDSYILVL